MKAPEAPIGRSFARLVTTGKGRRRNGYIEWECSCSCGTKKWVNKDNLLRGCTSSCGCLHRERTSAASRIDISGKRYGRLLVAGNTLHRRGCIYWLCRCDCGKETWVDGKHLRHGGTRSCGCLQRESRGKARRLRLAGRKFGRLSVTSQNAPRHGLLYWLCLCDCGRETWAASAYLTSGNTQSCGCLRREILADAKAARKQYTVDLNPELRRKLIREKEKTKPRSPEWIRASVLLLADGKGQGKGPTDTEIAQALDLTQARVFYIRHSFADDNFRAKQNAFLRKMWLKNPSYRIAKLLAHRIREAMKRQLLRKSNRTLDLLGCSLEYFCRYLEGRFRPGMGRANFGTDGWHLDHIRPCASFDLSRQHALPVCFHYTNYQPLWSSKNVRKSSSWQGKHWKHMEHRG